LFEGFIIHVLILTRVKVDGNGVLPYPPPMNAVSVVEKILAAAEPASGENAAAKTPVSERQRVLLRADAWA